MPLIDDGIRYKTEEKSTGYELVDGEKDTVIGITPTPRGKKTTPLQNYSTVVDAEPCLPRSSINITG